MPQIVYDEVRAIELKDDRWTIFAQKQKSDKSVEDARYVKIADFDTFLSLNGKHESQVVQNAIEKGQFRSVNKIKKPDICVIELAKGGSAQDIQLVLDNLKNYKNSIELLVVSTPFGLLENMNLIGLDYTFSTDNGSNLLIAKLTFQEIVYTRETAKSPKYPSWQKLSDMGRKAKSLIGW